MHHFPSLDGTDIAVLRPTVLLIGTLCRQLQALHAGIVEHDQAIAELFAQHPERALFTGYPAQVLAWPRGCAWPLGRIAPDMRVRALKQLSGIAPVVERSGRQHWTHWRWSAAPFLRQTFHKYAPHSLAKSARAQTYYRLQRQRDHGHQAAVRERAFTWIGVLFRCWFSRTPYDETRYLDALRRHQATLLEPLPPV